MTTDSLSVRNSKYISHLLDVGVIDADQHGFLLQKHQDHDEKKIVFEISNFFANFTASDWFDLSCRMFKNWQESYSSDLQAETGIGFDLNKRNKNNQQHKKPTKAAENTKKPATKSSDRELRAWGLSSQHKQQPQQKMKAPVSRGNPSTVEMQEMKDKLHRLANIMGNFAKKNSFSGLKNYSYFVRLSQSGFGSQDGREQAGYRNMMSSRSNGRHQGEEYHEKLYKDHFQKQLSMHRKREASKSTEMEGCTFAPKVNAIDLNNQALVNILNVPVYERLSQTNRQVPVNPQDTREMKELEGATFNPDISKSQRRWGRESAGSPEDIKMIAAGRLYSDAQMKEKILLLKQMDQKRQEAEQCTFSPQVLDPYSDHYRLQISKSVDRLYDENLKRQRKMLMKEVENKEQELDNCSFRPDREAKNYRVKNETDLDNLPVHHRLYERFSKKMERDAQGTPEMLDPLSADFAKSMTVSQERAIASAKEVKQFLKDQSYASVNTPAFDRLYNDMATRKVRLGQLKDKVVKEEGTTFKPVTNWSKSTKKPSIDKTSYPQDLGLSARYENKYASEIYLQVEPFSVGSESASRNLTSRANHQTSMRQSRNH